MGIGPSLSTSPASIGIWRLALSAQLGPNALVPPYSGCLSSGALRQPSGTSACMLAKSGWPSGSCSEAPA